MAKTLHATPLSLTEFTPYGGVISTKIISSQTITVNNGASRRTPEVVPTSNLYASAPSGKPGRTVLNASLASPRTVEPWISDSEEVKKRVLKANMLEHHPFTTQSFVPMGGKVLYLVVVTSTVNGIEGGKPDLDSLKAFVAREEEGVCYGVGVWHAPMAVIDQPVNFAVIQHVNGVADEDCEFFPLQEELEIVF